MRVEWLEKARKDYQDFLSFYRKQVGEKYAAAFAGKVREAEEQLRLFPKSGVLKKNSPLGRHNFRTLFVDQYVCIYRMIDDTVYIYRFMDARRNYIRQIFGYGE